MTVWDETGASAESEPAWFEMGLLEREDWHAAWIGAELAGGPREQHPCALPAPVVRSSPSASKAPGCT